MEWLLEAVLTQGENFARPKYLFSSFLSMVPREEHAKYEFHSEPASVHVTNNLGIDHSDVKSVLLIQLKW